MKKMLLGLILAIGAMLALSACGEKETPTTATKAYYEALTKQDFKTALDFCCDKEGKALDDSKKQSLVAMLNEKAKDEKQKAKMVEKYEIVEEKIAEDGKTAVVKVKTTSFDGEEKLTDTNCILVDGKWMINSGK